MKSGRKDKVEGTIQQATGKIKEVAGRITGQDDLTLAGKKQKAAGSLQKQVGHVKTVLNQ